MLEKEASGASPDRTHVLHPAGATPGGPFPPSQRPADAEQHPPQPSHSSTLQFLIAMIKKPSK